MPAYRLLQKRTIMSVLWWLHGAKRSYRLHSHKTCRYNAGRGCEGEKRVSWPGGSTPRPASSQSARPAAVPALRPSRLCRPLPAAPCTLAGGTTYIPSRKVTILRHGGSRRKRCWDIWGSTLSRDAWLANGALQWLAAKSQAFWLVALYLQCVKWRCWGACTRGLLWDRRWLRTGAWTGPRLASARRALRAPRCSRPSWQRGSPRASFPACSAIAFAWLRWARIGRKEVFLRQLSLQGWVSISKQSRKTKPPFSLLLCHTGYEGHKPGQHKCACSALPLLARAAFLGCCWEWQFEGWLEEDVHDEVMSDLWNILLKRCKFLQRKEMLQ